MNPSLIYALAGIGLFCLGLYTVIVRAHLLRKILALNVMAGGVFLILVALAGRTATTADPVPHAMVITGIVVAVAATALTLTLMLKLTAVTGRAELSDDEHGQPR